MIKLASKNNPEKPWKNALWDANVPKRVAKVIPNRVPKAALELLFGVRFAPWRPLGSKGAPKLPKYLNSAHPAATPRENDHCATATGGCEPWIASACSSLRLPCASPHLCGLLLHQWTRTEKTDTVNTTVFQLSALDLLARACRHCRMAVETDACFISFFVLSSFVISSFLGTSSYARWTTSSLSKVS